MTAFAVNSVAGVAVEFLDFPAAAVRLGSFLYIEKGCDQRRGVGGYFFDFVGLSARAPWGCATRAGRQASEHEHELEHELTARPPLIDITLNRRLLSC